MFGWDVLKTFQNLFVIVAKLMSEDTIVFLIFKRSGGPRNILTIYLL